MELCPKCNIYQLTTQITENNIHYGKKECKKCGFISWIKSPNTKNKLRIGKRKPETVAQFHGFGQPLCFLCLREKQDLPKKETLTVDHIKELSTGGKDEVQNTQILCSACHKLKNWLRLYTHWHVKEGI